MSQHNAFTKFTTAKGVELEVEVLMGYNKPLKHRFLLVQVLDDDIKLSEGEDIPESLRATSCVSEGIIYSDLFDANKDKDIEYFENKLIELGIKVPESMITACKSGEGVDPETGSMFHAFPETK